MSTEHGAAFELAPESEPELELEQLRRWLRLLLTLETAPCSVLRLSSGSAWAQLARTRGFFECRRSYSGNPGSTVLSHTPVCEAATFATSSGRPLATISPPRSPASGPRSTTQSASLMTSRLCSIRIS